MQCSSPCQRLYYTPRESDMTAAKQRAEMAASPFKSTPGAAAHFYIAVRTRTPATASRSPSHLQQYQQLSRVRTDGSLDRNFKPTCHCFERIVYSLLHVELIKKEYANPVNSAGTVRVLIEMP